MNHSNFGAYLCNTKVTHPCILDDAVVLAESMEVLVMALEALHENAEPLGL